MLHERTLSVWWTCRQVVHYELLPPGQTITADLYSQQLQRVHRALRQKKPALLNRKNVLFLHDNAKPHVAKRTRETIQQLGWETLCHAPDLTPTDYHLFHSLDNHLRGRSFANEGDLRNFFASKTADFYHQDIVQLQERCKRCWMLMELTSKSKGTHRALYCSLFITALERQKLFFLLPCINRLS